MNRDTSTEQGGELCGPGSSVLRFAPSGRLYGTVFHLASAMVDCLDRTRIGVLEEA